MIGPPVWQRLGEAFEFRWEQRRVTLTSFRESSGDLKCELSAEVAEGEDWVPLSGLMVLNLLAPRTRKEVATTLQMRDEDFAWHDAMEAIAVIAVREYRRGGPIVKLCETQAQDNIRYLVDRILPYGETAILFGDGESGKSLFSMFVAVAVATGYPLPGGLGPEEAGNVLYLDYEDGAEEHARRLRKISRGMGVDVPDNIFYRESHRPIHEEAPLLAKEIAQRKIDLIVVDSLAPACGDDPSAPGAAIATMNALRSLGGTRLAIGHVNKTDRNAPSANQTTFGSIFWRNMTRAMWQLQANSEGSPDGRAPFALYNRKQNNAAREKNPIGMQYIFQPSSIAIESYFISPAEALAEGGSLGNRIVQVLGRSSKTTDELAEMFSTDGAGIRKALQRLGNAVVQLDPGTPGRGGKSATWGLRGR